MDNPYAPGFNAEKGGETTVDTAVDF